MNGKPGLERFLKELSSAVFYLIIFLLPWQARYFIYTSYINGSFWEYGSFSIYAIDVFLFLFFSVTVLILIFSPKTFKILPAPFLMFISSGLIFLFFNIVLSEYGIALLNSFRFFIALIFFYIAVVIPFSKKTLIWAFVLGAFISSIFGVYQFIAQSVFGSTFLGIAEQLPHISGASVVEYADGRFIRAYGTLSHPNALGGFLGLSLFALMYLLITARSSIERILIYSITFILSAALVFTFSRSAMLSFFTVSTLLFYLAAIYKHSFFKQTLFFFLIVVFAIAGTGLLTFPLIKERFTLNDRLTRESIEERLKDYSLDREASAKDLFIGIGVGSYTAFTSKMDNFSKSAWAYQPHHNAYILAFMEIGGIGVFILALLIFFIIKGVAVYIRNGRMEDTLPWAPMLIFILITSLFDHFWWSSHFGIIIFYLILALNLRFVLPLSRNP